MLTLPKNTALILIDVQKGFNDPHWGLRNNPHLESNILRLLNLWRENSLPVIHVKHMSTEPDSPLRPGQIGNEFKDEAMPAPGETVFEKKVNSAFIGTDLEKHLRANKLTSVLIAGISTDHCISTSTRMAGNLGFTTFVAADACATFNRTAHDGTKLTAAEVHTAALASLHNEFATVAATEKFAEALAGSLAKQR